MAAFHITAVFRRVCQPVVLTQHIVISGILGISREKDDAIGSGCSSCFWIEEWGYPDIGVAICDCPSAGHDMVFLDYRFCGPAGEPAVVHIDQEDDYCITFLAHDFKSFIRGLVHEDLYDTSETTRHMTWKLHALLLFRPFWLTYVYGSGFGSRHPPHSGNCRGG